MTQSEIKDLIERIEEGLRDGDDLEGMMEISGIISYDELIWAEENLNIGTTVSLKS